MAKFFSFSRGPHLARRYPQIAYCLLLLLVVWFSVFAMLVHDYRRAEGSIQQKNDQFSRGFEEHVRRSFYAVEEQLLLIKDEYEREGLTPVLLYAFERARQNPLLIQILILDSGGKIVQGVQQGPSDIDLSDRSYFATHIAADSGRLFISEPSVGRITKKMSIYLSRRLNRPDGGFAGVVMIAVDPAYFADFYQAVGFGPGQLIRVVGLDGVVRASWTADNSELGQRMLNSDLFEHHLPVQANGHYLTQGRRFGEARYFSYRTMRDYPLVVQVGISAEQGLADYHQRRDAYLSAAALASLLLLFFSGMAIRSSKRRRQADERWKLVVQGLNDGIWDYDLSTGRSYFSDRCKEILGYAATELDESRMDWMTLLHPDDADRIRRGRAANLANGAPRYSEIFRLRCKDDSYRWVRSRGAALRDEAGGLIRMIGSLTDIHAEKIAAEALRVSTRELRENREKYKALIDQSFEAVALIDPARREIVEMNQRFTEWFGYSLPADAPMLIDHLLVDLEDLKPESYGPLLATGYLPVERRTMRHQNGSFVFVERSVTLVNHRDGQQVMLTCRNIAEKIEQERSRLQDAQIARRIQSAQLSCPPDSEYVELASVFRPCGDISGDLYHLEWRNDGQLLRGYLVDVAGQGLTTALYTSTVNVLLHEAAEQDASLPEQVHWLSRQVACRFEPDAVVAAIAFEIDLQLREVRYVGAGINRFWADMATIKGSIEAPGLYLGSVDEQDYCQNSLPLTVPDRLYFATDGLARLLDKEKGDLWADCGQLGEWLDGLPNQTDRPDDVTVVCIRIKSLPASLLSEGWPKELSLNGFDDYRRLKGEVAKVLAKVTGKPHSIQEVAVNEAIANALECRDGVARSQKARIKFNRIGDRLIIRVKTSRIGFAGNAILRRLRATPEKLFSYGEDASMGRGIPLMLSLSDKMTYNHDGTEVLLAWKFGSAKAGT